MALVPVLILNFLGFFPFPLKNVHSEDLSGSCLCSMEHTEDFLHQQFCLLYVTPSKTLLQFWKRIFYNFAWLFYSTPNQLKFTFTCLNLLWNPKREQHWLNFTKNKQCNWSFEVIEGEFEICRRVTTIFFQPKIEIFLEDKNRRKFATTFKFWHIVLSYVVTQWGLGYLKNVNKLLKLYVHVIT